MNEKSEVELFYSAIAKKMQGARPFNQLHPIEVQRLCDAISIILGVVRNG